MSNFLSPGRMAERLVHKSELDKEQCARFSSELFDIIIRELKKEESFSLFGFGTFKKSFVQPSTARNPQTGEAIDVPAHYRIRFSPAGKFAERINADYAHLKPVILETEERVKEGLLLKAERYIMTIQAEPEPAGHTDRTDGENASEDASEERIDELIEKTVVSPAPAIERTEDDEVSPDQTAREIEPEEELSEQPDFNFQKERGKGSVKLILLTLLALILILAAGWLLFRNIGDDGVTEILVSEAVTEEIQQPEAAVEEPEAPAVSAEENMPETSYSIETGDSFSLLAQRSWGNIYLWPYLYSRNSTSFPDPDLVRPGDSIVIPPEPDRTRDQIRIEDSIIFAYTRYRELIEEQASSARNPNREISAGYVLLGGERLYPDFLERRKEELRVEDIRRVQRLGE